MVVIGQPAPRIPTEAAALVHLARVAVIPNAPLPLTNLGQSSSGRTGRECLPSPTRTVRMPHAEPTGPTLLALLSLFLARCG